MSRANLLPRDTILDLLVAKSGLHEKFKTNISLLLDVRHSCNPIIVRGGLLVHSAFMNEFIH